MAGNHPNVFRKVLHRVEPGGKTLKVHLILVMAVLLTGVASTCMAKTFTQKTGPFTIQVTSDQNVSLDYVADPNQMDDYNVYDVSLDVGDKEISPWWIEIRDYGKLIDVDLMLAIASVYPSPPFDFFTSLEFPEVGGKPGVIGTIGKGGKNINGVKGLDIYPGFVAAYSPDGYGDHGTIIAIIYVNADEKNFEECKSVFENVVKDIRILKTG